MGSLQIDVLNTSFTIKVENENDSYLERLLKYYRDITEQIKTKGVLSSNLQIAIMAGIMLCDELYQEKSEKDRFKKLISESDAKISDGAEYHARVEKLTLEMIKTLDKALT